MTQMGIYFDQTRCTGCYTCAVACKDWFDIQSGTVNRMRVTCHERGMFPDLFAAYTAVACCHCENPSCVKVCPAGAINKSDANGIVIVDQDKCLGNNECHAPCLKACPWDAPQFGPEEGALMNKCDLCIELTKVGQEPACVASCPTGALEFCEPSELLIERRRTAAKRVLAAATEQKRNNNEKKDDSDKS